MNGVMSRPALRRLIDLPGIDDLEYRALMTPSLAEPEARTEHPEIDELSRTHFGITADEAGQVPRPEGWDNIEDQPPARQVFAFEDAGWDVTDSRRRPLRVLGHFSAQMWLAIRGVAGSLPFQAEDDTGGDWGASLSRDAARFRKR
jgi:hypothetical protein